MTETIEAIVSKCAATYADELERIQEMSDVEVREYSSFVPSSTSVKSRPLH